MSWVVRLFLVCITIAVGGALATRLFRTAPPDLASSRASVVGTLSTRNALGRTGAYFLPPGYYETKLPLAVLVHGTGGSGAQMVALFRDVAEREQFVVVAPDSRISPSGSATWEVGGHPGEITPDFDHIHNCVAEVLAMPGVAIDVTRILIAGHSGGASTAPYVASIDELYTSFAVLHGGVFAGGLGPRRVRGWFSTGDADPLRPSKGVRDAADTVRRMGFGAIEYQEFRGGHEIGAQELRGLVAWWLHE